MEGKSCNSRFETIPEEILQEIVMRLHDFRTVIQSMSVCKHWYSAISSLCCFNKNKTSKCFTLLFQWHIDASINPEFPVLIAPSTYDINATTILDFMKPLKYTDVVASFDDLLLVKNYVTCFNYYVVNPLLREWIRLPPPPRLSYPDIQAGMCFRVGFLWDYSSRQPEPASTSSNNNLLLVFKVIRISCCLSEAVAHEHFYPHHHLPNFLGLGLDTAKFRVQIYSSDTNIWSEYIVDWYSFRLTQYLNDFPIISHNGMFHWLNGDSLVSLDPFDLKLNDAGLLRLTRVIELPKNNMDSDSHPFPTLRGLGVCEGHLRVIITYFDQKHNWFRSYYQPKVSWSPSFHHPTIVWQLDETKIIGDADADASAQDIWCKVHKFEFGDASQFLNFHPYDGDVIFAKEKDSFGVHVRKINLRTKKVTKFEQHNPNCWLRNQDHCPPLPPLIHPWYPTRLSPAAAPSLLDSNPSI